MECCLGNCYSESTTKKLKIRTQCTIPSGSWIRKQIAKIPKEKMIVLLSDGIDQTISHLKNMGMLNHPVTVAIDKHFIPRYDKTDSAYLIKSRPQNAIDNFWRMMNQGIRFLSNHQPKFSNASSCFRDASRLMQNEIQFLVPETRNYTMTMNDLKSLAETYSQLCQAMIEFDRNGDFQSPMQNALNEMDRSHGAMGELHHAIQSMCRAFMEGENTETNFAVAIDSVPEEADSGAVILVLMALMLNRREKKYDGLIDELHRKLGIT